jgi:hypothetical protein
MTVASCDEYRKRGADGRLDLPATAAHLRAMSERVGALAAEGLRERRG